METGPKLFCDGLFYSKLPAESDVEFKGILLLLSPFHILFFVKNWVEDKSCVY